MLTCDWCRDPIQPDEPEATFSIDYGARGPGVRSYLRLHQDCGIMALYWAGEHIEDHAPGERPDPATEELLEHIPTYDGSAAPYGSLDGPATSRMRLVRHLGERRATYALYDAGVGTLLDASFQTRAALAAVPGVGRSTLATLETAMRRHGLHFCGGKADVPMADLAPPDDVTDAAPRQDDPRNVESEAAVLDRVLVVLGDALSHPSVSAGWRDAFRTSRDVLAEHVERGDRLFGEEDA